MHKGLGGSVLFMMLSGYLAAGQSVEQSQPMNGQDKIAMIHGCAQLAASIVQKSYGFFVRQPIHYDLQIDVLDHPYKNMLYTSTQAIEKLFEDANLHDNPHAQIKALILLCRMPVPEWYLKNFYKGMDQLFQRCFDDSGNFKDASNLGDIRLMFREYSRKTPSSWQQIARISPWWCRNKKPYAVYTKYYAMSCTDYNEDLLRMIGLDPVQDLAYLKYLVSKHESAPALKIYHAHVVDIFKHTIDESSGSKQ
jgi:hypothetical protein